MSASPANVIVFRLSQARRRQEVGCPGEDTFGLISKRIKMTKAFMKESDGETESDDAVDGASAAIPGLPEGSRNYMTPAGARMLRDELQNLLKVERPKVVQTVSWAASRGRSENGIYLRKRRLRKSIAESDF